MTPFLVVAPDVSSALAAGEPVVALETTLVAHGFPPPEGAAVGLECERRVRSGGATPATIGVLDGAIRVGLRPEELERFGSSPHARKAGPRELAACAVDG
ncbi:MAG: pseudouridine-5'-phosphate glycosidase, partial [Actinomycetota bacterium]|nr:pseudouridine-5'-phosphate glycosidase [Actinomycetota bacterium]